MTDRQAKAKWLGTDHAQALASENIRPMTEGGWSIKKVYRASSGGLYAVLEWVDLSRLEFFTKTLKV